jgi:pyruvate/2-oxoglutarate dehydrogenase complex dihydrolipoamide dehydrogenase (E3) component
MPEFDVIVIGGGSAGYAAARTAAAAGAKVAVVEGGREVGGLCILRGCMPTKALLESSHRWHDIKRASEFGLQVDAGNPSLKKIMARKDLLIADFAGYRRRQLKRGAFAFVRGTAHFKDPFTLEVLSGKKLEIYRSKTFIIATGSEVKPLDLPGLEQVGYLTSDSALTLQKLPKSLLVLGGGAIAVEFAQFFHHLGVPTTIIQRSAHLLKDFDADTGQTLQAALQHDGLKIYTQTHLLKAGRRGKEKTVTFEYHGKPVTIAAREILFALGRRPAIQGLRLPEIAVEIPNEAVKADPTMRTNLPHIFAAGDVTSQYEVVHIAIRQGEVAGWNAAQVALGNPAKLQQMDYRLKAAVIFTQPEVASVGLTEVEAKEQGIAYVTASYPFNDLGKAMIMGTEYGFLKLLAEKTRGEIIGAQIIGPHASDLIHELIAVMHYHGTAQDLLDIPHYHPTLAEIVTFPAEEIVEKLGKHKTV